METVAVTVSEPSAKVMKLTDFEEYTPAPPPPPLLAEIPPVIAQNTVEAVAETMIETDELPPDMVVVDALSSSGEDGFPGGVVGGVLGGLGENYLPMNKISVAPKFNEREIRNGIVYPAIAQRSGIEGIVYLELFVDRHGEIKQISILRETPEGRGFGDAAVKAFSGITAMSPAFANGVAVGVRYRYPVRFSITN
jgi:protein TonB